MSSSRVANSLRNVFAAWGGQAVSAIASFVVRMAFVFCSRQEYLGLETLFRSLLTILHSQIWESAAQLYLAFTNPWPMGIKSSLNLL